MSDNPDVISNTTTIATACYGRVLSFVTYNEKSRMRMFLSETLDEITVYITDNKGGNFKFTLKKESLYKPIFNAVYKMLGMDKKVNSALNSDIQKVPFLARTIFKNHRSDAFDSNLMFKLKSRDSKIRVSITNIYKMGGMQKSLHCHFYIMKSEDTKPIFDALTNL